MHANSAKEDHGRATEGLVLGPILALVFLGFSFLRILGDVSSALFDSRVRIAPLDQPIWGMLLGYRLAGFAGALVLVHLLLGVAAWAMAWLTRHAWPGSGSRQRAWTCLWLAGFVVWILTANAAWFPSSSLGNPYAGIVHASLAGVSVFGFISLAVAAAIGVTVSTFAWRHRRELKAPRPAIAAPVAVVLLSAFAASMHAPTVWTRAAAGPSKPNIIVIGLDSVRADVRDPAAGNSVPALKAFLRDATVFRDTTTPLARTFAAWVSILTGRNPHTTGATVNLLPRDLIKTGKTLPDMLRDAGYKTVYGIDEVRFSNIDESYGFDETVTPRIGSTDFLVEFFGDTPLSNLLVNTRLGDGLFPELHGNRAAKLLYDPDTFVHDLDRTLYFDSPTFLAVHLTLAHWPYTWASSDPRARGTVDAALYPELYAAAVERVDRQFGDLMTMLERKGALDNAIVVVLSDHGESLGENSPLADAEGHLSPVLGDAAVYGHGTHVFSENQYKVLLAVRAYGHTPLQLTPGERFVPASLEDITPTLSDALDLKSDEPFDGRSLMPYLNGREHGNDLKPAPRIRFLETEFNPPGVAIEQTITTSAIAKASASYRIDAATDRVEVRPEQLARILDSRQYAAVLGDHWMATVPASGQHGQYLVYVGPEAEGPVWLDAPPSADSSPIQQKLWNALQQRFDAVANRAVVPLPQVER